MAPKGSWFARLWSKDRRRAKRQTALPLVAHYWDGAAPQPHQVRDISLAGMYLLTDVRWYPKTLVRMTLTRSDMADTDPDRSIAVTTQVVRPGDDGVGFAFILAPSMLSTDANGSVRGDADRDSMTKFLERLRADTSSEGAN